MKLGGQNIIWLTSPSCKGKKSNNKTFFTVNKMDNQIIKQQNIESNVITQSEEIIDEFDLFL